MPANFLNFYAIVSFDRIIPAKATYLINPKKWKYKFKGLLRLISIV